MTGLHTKPYRLVDTSQRISKIYIIDILVVGITLKHCEFGPVWLQEHSPRELLLLPRARGLWSYKIRALSSRDLLQ